MNNRTQRLLLLVVMKKENCKTLRQKFEDLYGCLLGTTLLSDLCAMSGGERKVMTKVVNKSHGYVICSMQENKEKFGHAQCIAHVFCLRYFVVSAIV